MSEQPSDPQDGAVSALRAWWHSLPLEYRSSLLEALLTCVNSPVARAALKAVLVNHFFK